MKALLQLAVAGLALVAAMADTDTGTETTYDTLPDFFPKQTCRRNDRVKVLDACIRNNFQAIVPAIRKGGRLGLPSLEPYYVPEVGIDFKNEWAQLHATLTNMTVRGLSNIIVRDASSNLKDDTMELVLDVFFPKMTFGGAFAFDNGLFAQWKFVGKGPFEFTFYGVSATWKIEGRRQPGGRHMSVYRFTPVYTVDGMQANAQGLVDGYPHLDAVIVSMVNRLWPEFVEIGKPFVQKSISDHLRQFTEDVFQSVPYDLIFPRNSSE